MNNMDVVKTLDKAFKMLDKKTYIVTYLRLIQRGSYTDFDEKQVRVKADSERKAEEIVERKSPNNQVVNVKEA